MGTGRVAGSKGTGDQVTTGVFLSVSATSILWCQPNMLYCSSVLLTPAPIRPQPDSLYCSPVRLSLLYRAAARFPRYPRNPRFNPVASPKKG